MSKDSVRYEDFPRGMCRSSNVYAQTSIFPYDLNNLALELNMDPFNGLLTKIKDMALITEAIQFVMFLVMVFTKIIQ